MSDPAFIAQDGSVLWLTSGGHCKLDSGQVRVLLGIFAANHNQRLFLQLDDADTEARTQARAVLRDMLVRSVEQGASVAETAALDGGAAGTPRLSVAPRTPRQAGRSEP